MILASISRGTDCLLCGERVQPWGVAALAPEVLASSWRKEWATVGAAQEEAGCVRVCSPAFTGCLPRLRVTRQDKIHLPLARARGQDGKQNHRREAMRLNRQKACGLPAFCPGSPHLRCWRLPKSSQGKWSVHRALRRTSEKPAPRPPIA